MMKAQEMILKATAGQVEAVGSAEIMASPTRSIRRSRERRQKHDRQERDKCPAQPATRAEMNAVG